MAEQEQNRSEEATPYKLEEARKKGSVAKSQELNSFVMLIWTALMIVWLGPTTLHKTLDLIRVLFDQALEMSFDEGHIAQWVPSLFVNTLIILLPIFIGIVVVCILINVLQTGGPIFSFFPLKPDLERINPMSGFKRLFSIRIIVETVKTLIKTVLLGMTLYFFISALLPTSIRFFQMEPSQYIGFLFKETGALVLKLCAALAGVVAIDVLYTRWDFSDRMRMSKYEVKEEIKRREGDPRIRQKIRELQREAAKRQSALQNVKDADVLITNPTHISIALKYRRDEMDAPKVLAKGAGELAAQMRLLSRRYQIPVVENKKLARALFRETKIDHSIREIHFPEIAKILVWAYAQRQSNIGSREDQA